MHVLYVDRTFPGQFGHLAQYLARNHGAQCTYVSQHPDATVDGIRCLQYEPEGGPTKNTHFLSRSFESHTWHSQAVYEMLKARPDIEPDVVVGRSGAGATILLANLYDCPIVNLFEFFHRTDQYDKGFRRGDSLPKAKLLESRSRNAVILLDLLACTRGYCPTEWQLGHFPDRFHYKLETIPHGIDTTLWRRFDPADLRDRQVGERTISPQTRIVSYAPSGLDASVRFEVFTEIAKRIGEASSDVVFVCVGNDRILQRRSKKRSKAISSRESALAVDPYNDERFLFTGGVVPAEVARILNLSDLHIHLNEPTILGNSLMKALACGCTVLGSDTEPVQEIITHGKNGLLAGFSDVGRLAELALQVLDDPPAFASLSEAGMHMIHEKYSLEKTVPKMIRMYEAAIEQKQLDRSEKDTGDDDDGGTVPDSQEVVMVHDNRTAVRASDGERDAENDAGRRRAELIVQLKNAHPWPLHSEDDCRDISGSANQVSLGFLDHMMRLDVVGGADLVVELHSQYGYTTRYIAGMADHVSVVAVGHWCADPGDRYPHGWESTIADSFSEFAATCSQKRGQIIPLRATTFDALTEVARVGLTPDIVYINSSEPVIVEENLARAMEVFPTTKCVGNSWNAPSGGARKFVRENAVEVEVTRNTWRIWKETDAWSSFQERTHCESR